MPDSQAFPSIPSQQCIWTPASRPSQRKQRQAKDVLAKGVVVSVLRHGTASETDGVRALEAVQWLCPCRWCWRKLLLFFLCLEASSGTYFLWKCLRWSESAFHCVRWWPKFSVEHRRRFRFFPWKAGCCGLGPALQAEPWCWTQSTDLLPTLSGIGRVASLSQLLELEDLVLWRRRLVRAAQVVTLL